MDPLIGGALIGGLGSIIGNIGSGSRQKKADERNIAFWKMQNEYNNPSSQMKRLREAGLNPNLVYGGKTGGMAGDAGAISPSKAPDFTTPDPLRDINKYADTGVKQAQTNNLETQNTVYEQEAIHKAAQTASLGASTAKTAFDLGLARDLRETSLEAGKANLRNIQSKNIGLALDNHLKDQSLKPAIMRIYYEAQYAKDNLTGLKLQNQIKRFEISLNKLGLTKGDALWSRIIGKNKNEFQRKFAQGYSPSPSTDYFKKRNQGNKKFGLTPKY